MKQKVKAVLFFNWTDRDFTHTWDGVEYTFKKNSKQYLEEFLARHFAKHLATREIYKEGKILAGKTYEDYKARCLVLDDEIEADDSQKLNTDIENKKDNEPVINEPNSDEPIDPESEEAEEQKLRKDLNKIKKDELLEKAKTELGMEFEEGKEPNKPDLIEAMIPRYLVAPDPVSEEKSEDEQGFEGAK